MKAIIHGFRYDTEKAEKLGEYRTTNGRGDFHFFEESLYRTPKAHRYFLAGAGGAMSRYAVSCGQNQWTGGEKIITLTDAEALEWAEQFLTADETERIFAESIVDA